MSAGLRTSLLLLFALAVLGRLAHPRVVFAPTREGSAARAAVPSCTAAPSPRTAPFQRGRRRPPAPPLRPFQGDLEAARREARERNVPLLLHVILEGEEQNDEYRRKVLPDPDLLRASVHAVVVVANNGNHPPEDWVEEVDGRKIPRRRCSVYPMFDNCQQHRAAWDQVYAEYQEKDGALRCPQTVICLPDGKQTWRVHDGAPPPPSRVRAELEFAQEKAGKGLTREEFVEVKRLVGEGRTMLRAKAWPDAWRAWEGVLAIATAGRYAEEARAGIEAARAEVAADIAAAREWLVPGTAARGYARLLELEGQLKGLPPESEVRKLKLRAEKDRAIREEIRAFRLEQEAAALWREANDWLEAGQERRAERLIRKLLRPRFAATKSAAEAARQYPDWAAEERGG